MPRVDFELWDRVYILKLICTAQATYSSFVVLIYVYLIILQSWTAAENDRSDVMTFKWSVIAVGVLEFGLGILLAFAANMTGIRCKLRIIIWIIFETFLIPVSIFLLMQLQKRLNNSKEYETDTHYSRVNTAQVCFLLTQYLFIAYAIDFLVQGQRKAKTYDPSIRPKSVYAPTDPQITTTESRHIRMSQSLLFQPSSSKAPSKNSEKESYRISVEFLKKKSAEAKEDEKKVRVRVESEMSGVHNSLESDAKIESFLFENKKKIYPWQKVWEQGKEDEDSKQCLREERTEWLQSEDKEKESGKDQEKEQIRDEIEAVNTDKPFKENDNLNWAELEGSKKEETKLKDHSIEL